MGAVCGPKLSMCCTIISVWGIVQLLLMGAFYYAHSVALTEDLPEPEFEGNLTAADASPEQHYTAITKAYAQNAYNCWVAVGMYIATLVFSVSQIYMNKRDTYSA